MVKFFRLLYLLIAGLLVNPPQKVTFVLLDALSHQDLILKTSSWQKLLS